MIEDNNLRPSGNIGLRVTLYNGRSKESPMRKIVCVAVMMICCIARAAAPTSAPSGRPGEGPRDPAKILERAKEIATSLKLSDEQKTKIDDIFTKANADVKEMKVELETLEPQQRMKQ